MANTAGHGEPAFLRTGEQGAAEDGAKDESFHGLFIFGYMSPIMARICSAGRRLDTMERSLAVGIAQLVERRIVVPDVVGSNPTTHPTLTPVMHPPCAHESRP